MALHRRVEFRIRILKRLIGNLGPNLNTANIQKINRVVDLKEKLLLHAKKAFGVKKRSGAHKNRSDKEDFDKLVDNLTELKADQIVPGRQFGNIKYAKNLLDSERFNAAEFYRWVATKNKDAVEVYQSSNASTALPKSQ